MIIPAISYITQHPCAGTALLPHDSAQGCVSGIVVTEPVPGVPYGIVTGIVIAKHYSEKAIPTGIVQGTKTLTLDIINADLRDDEVTHEHITLSGD